MLVLTGLAYFLLSKQHKTPAANGPLGQYSDSFRASTADPSTDGAEQTYTFPRGSCQGERRSLLSYVRSILRGCWSQEGAVDSYSRRVARRQVRLEEKAINIVLSVQDNAGRLDQETVSDTAPILGPTAETSP